MTETQPSKDKYPACMESMGDYVERWSKFSIKDRNAIVMKMSNGGLALIVVGVCLFGGMFGGLTGGGQMSALAAFWSAFGGSLGMIMGGVQLRRFANACIDKEKTLAAGVDLISNPVALSI